MFCFSYHIIYYLAVKGDIDIFHTSKSKNNENTRKRKSEKDDDDDDDEDDESDDDVDVDGDDDDDDHKAKNRKPILKNDEEINCFRNQMQIKVKG
jgi:hypothetical protein